jgi:hypothetical protein
VNSIPQRMLQFMWCDEVGVEYVARC